MAPHVRRTPRGPARPRPERRTSDAETETLPRQHPLTQMERGMMTTALMCASERRGSSLLATELGRFGGGLVGAADRPLSEPRPNRSQTHRRSGCSCLLLLLLLLAYLAAQETRSTPRHDFGSMWVYWSSPQTVGGVENATILMRLAPGGAKENANGVGGGPEDHSDARIFGYGCPGPQRLDLTLRNEPKLRHRFEGDRRHSHLDH